VQCVESGVTHLADEFVGGREVVKPTYGVNRSPVNRSPSAGATEWKIPAGGVRRGRPV